MTQAQSPDIQWAWLCVPRSRWKEEEVGQATSIRSEKSESGMAAATGTSGPDALPWSQKECTLLCVYDEFCFILRAPRSEKSAEGLVECVGRVSRRSLLLPSFAMLLNRSQHAGAHSHETSLRCPNGA